MENVRNFNQAFTTARHDLSRRFQIASLGTANNPDFLHIRRVWIQPHTPRQLHADELLHVAQEVAQSIAKQTDTEFSVVREDANTFCLRFSAPQAEVFGEHHPAPAFTGKPLTQNDDDAIYKMTCMAWRGIVQHVTGFSDAKEAVRFAKAHGFEDHVDAAETLISRASTNQLRQAILDEFEGMTDNDPLIDAMERLADDVIPAAVIREAVNNTLTVFGVEDYL